MKDTRKGKVVTVKIGADKQKRIPALFSTIYRMIKTPWDDKDNPDEDETLCTRTLETVYVEGLTGVKDDEGNDAVSVNGEFEISLKDEDDDERYSDKKIWADREEAIEVWEHNTKRELERAKKYADKYNHIVNSLELNLEEKQY